MFPTDVTWRSFWAQLCLGFALAFGWSTGLWVFAHTIGRIPL